ncbi:hypothetical protein [Pseudorhodoferax soli]|uniref:hypothetical protein n=1 Tax=Pseudorhodoferax soli TaxID=545864 RepID=UPI0011C0451B|nr:hypothetical protein [Pseudorhodoferax soli]
MNAVKKKSKPGESFVDHHAVERAVEKLAERCSLLLARVKHWREERLRTDRYMSVAEAAAALGLQQRTVLRRIAHRKLIALWSTEAGRYRVLACSLALTPQDTKILMDAVDGSNGFLEWYLETPQVKLNGMRPLDLIVASENHSRAARAKRRRLVESLAELGSSIFSTEFDRLRLSRASQDLLLA